MGERDVASPLGAPWPLTARRAGGGAEHPGAIGIGGFTVQEIDDDHGTPTFVVDEADFRERARAFRDAFADAFEAIGSGCDVYYASKAFLSRGVARWAHSEGLRIDTASGLELTTALRAGVPGADVALHGNNKSVAEIDLALSEGVGRIVVDSLAEVDAVAGLAAGTGVVAPVMVRVTTGVHAGGHESIATAHEDQKFGLSITAGPDGDDSPAMAALRAVVARPELRLLGIHSHIGSQILDAGGFEQAARLVMGLRADLARETGVLVDEVDLGGGYGIAYLPGEEALDPALIAPRIAATVEAVARELGTPLPRFSIEPGRAIVGRSGITVYTVGTVKPVTVTADDGTTFTRTYVSVDGGMSDNIRTVLYDAEYHAELASRSSDVEPVLCRVVGKHCESGDIVVRDVMLPGDIRSGDLLAVAATGAYGRSMASNYNMLLKPPAIAVRDGEARVLIRRETPEDLLGLDQG